MSIDTGSVPGEQQRVFAQAPDFPSNLGKIDVAAIYDAASKAMGQPEALANAARQGTAGNSALKTMLQQEVAKRSLIPAQTGAAAAEAALGTAKPGALAGLWNRNPLLAASVEKGNVPTTTAANTYIDTDPNSPTKGQVVNKSTLSIGGQVVGGATTGNPYNFTVDELVPPEGGVAAINTNSYHWDPEKGPRTIASPDGSGKQIPNPASTTLVNSTTAPVIPREQPDKLQQAVDAYVRAKQIFGAGSQQANGALDAYNRVATESGVAPPAKTAEGERLIDEAVLTQEQINTETDPAKAAVLGAKLQDIRNRQAALNAPANKPNNALSQVDEKMIGHWTAMAETAAKIAATMTAGSPEQTAQLKKADDFSAKAEAIGNRYQAPGAVSAPTAAAAPKGPPPSVSIGGVSYPTFTNDKTGAVVYVKNGRVIPLPTGGAPAEPAAAPAAAPVAPAEGVPPLLARPEATPAAPAAPEPAPVAPAAPAAPATPAAGILAKPGRKPIELKATRPTTLAGQVAALTQRLYNDSQQGTASE